MTDLPPIPAASAAAQPLTATTATTPTAPGTPKTGTSTDPPETEPGHVPGGLVEVVEVDAAGLAADAELLDHIRRAGFTGPTYDVFLNQISEVAFASLSTWIRTGEIVGLVRAKGLAISVAAEDLSVLHSSRGERDDLVIETWTCAWEYFRNRVLPAGADKEWRPEGGARLQSYFVGCCITTFRGAYDRWKRTRAKRQEMQLDGALLEARFAGPDASDPAALVAECDEQRAIIRALLEQAPDRTQIICCLIMLDVPREDIAARLGISLRAIEGVLHRLRRQARKMIRTGKLTVLAALLPVDRAAGEADR